MNNVFYFANINSIGGVESFFYYLCKKYSDRDITIYYKTGDYKQINRLRKYARVVRYTDGEIIKCKKVFFNYNADIIDNVEAEEYIQIIHADYKLRGLKPKFNDKITKYIGVSKRACESFTAQTGKPCELCYNPVAIDKPEKPLLLVSATRLTAEKGKNRMQRLANYLEAEGVNFLWLVFTNDTDEIKNDNIVYMSPRLNVTDYISIADWFVQLSSEEAYCYSVVEALMLNVPVIVTPCPVFKELGLNESNSLTLDFNFEIVPIEKIKAGLKVSGYTPPKDNWGQVLTKHKSTYKPEQTVSVIAIQKYYDLEYGKTVNKNTILNVDEGRAITLVKAGVVKRL